MDVGKTLNDARAILQRWPAGAFVWHRANGRRGIVEGWKICADGAILISVSWGDTCGLHFFFELSARPVPEGSEGEEWRLAEPESGGDDPAA